MEEGRRVAGVLGHETGQGDDVTWLNGRDGLRAVDLQDDTGRSAGENEEGRAWKAQDTHVEAVARPVIVVRLDGLDVETVRPACPPKQSIVSVIQRSRGEQSQADPSEGGAARSHVDAPSEMATRQQNTHDLAVTRPLRPCTRCPSYELSQPGPWMSCGESAIFGGSWKAAWARGSEGGAAASGWAEAARAKATAGRSTTGGSMGWLRVQRLNPIREGELSLMLGREGEMGLEARPSFRRDDRPTNECAESLAQVPKTFFFGCPINQG